MPNSTDNQSAFEASLKHHGRNPVMAHYNQSITTGRIFMNTRTHTHTRIYEFEYFPILQKRDRRQRKLPERILYYIILFVQLGT